MNRAHEANRRRTSFGRTLVGLSALLLAACGTPGRDLSLALAAQALPGAGGSVTLAQTLTGGDERRLDFELGLERQSLEGWDVHEDRWSRIWAGFVSRVGAPRAHLQGRAGVTWLRSEAEASGLEAGDYGGAYVGAGWSMPVGARFSTGPAATFLYLDSEGNRSGSGGLVELAWSFCWHL